MNRRELIDAVSYHTGLTRKQSESALGAIIFEVTTGVHSGEPVRITGFGTFKLRIRESRVGRNPRTGELVRIQASRGIGFTPGVGLKGDLNARSAPASPKPLVGSPPEVKGPPVAVPAKKQAPSIGTVTIPKAARRPVMLDARATGIKKAAPSKKAVAKKAVAKKAVAKKAVAKKAVAKKAVAKKAVAKKAVAKKAVAKKAAPSKKAAAKRAHSVARSVRSPQ
jgi:DNA-binding protein HU-beta